MTFHSLYANLTLSGGDFIDTINERIACLIRHLGMTKTKFAEQLSISQPFVSSICAGIKVPSDRTISDICREFNVSETWLRTGEGEMFRQLDPEDEMMELVGRFLADESNSFKRRYLRLMLKLTDEDWKRAEIFARELLGMTDADIPQTQKED